MEWLCVNLRLHAGHVMHFLKVKIIRMIDVNVTYGFLTKPLEIADAMTGSLGKETNFSYIVDLD